MSKAAVGDETFHRADHLGQESAVIVGGTVRADTRAHGRVQLDVTSSSRQRIRSTIRLRLKNTALDYLMDRRHLWIRAPRQAAVLRIRHEVIARSATTSTAGLHPADTPVFTPSACEGRPPCFPYPTSTKARRT